MRAIYYIAIVILFWGCDPEVDNDLLVVNGYVAGVKDIVHVEVRRFENEKSSVVTDAVVRLTLGDQEIPLYHQGNGVYAAPLEDGAVIPGYAADIEVRANKTVSSKAVVPPSISILEQSGATFSVDANNAAAEVFSMQWTNRDGYSYLLRLENLESSPIEIEFADDPIQFDEVYSSPIEENNITLFAGDFKYYGAHRLTIYVVPEAYRDLFFFQNTGLGELVVQGPDNVEGGFGTWTAINAEEIILTVLP